MFLIEAPPHKCKALIGCTSKNFNNKVCRPMPTTVVYSGNRNHINLCLQGSGDLRMCGSQTDWNITLILMLIGDLLTFHHAFGVNLSNV